MVWLDRLERRMGWLAVPGLLRYVAALNALVFILYKYNPYFIELIDLDARSVMQGQVWRLLTYIFIPQIKGGFLVFSTPDWFNAAFSVFFLIWVGDRLEEAWGAFKLTLYWIIGMIGTTIAAFFFGAQFSNQMLLTSVFFAFARFYPDLVIFFAFILPLKVKWIAWIYAAFLFLQFVSGTMAVRSAMIVALANYLIFFGPEIWFEARHRSEVSTRRRKFESQVRSATDEPLHRCKVCGQTENDDPYLEFRVARDGEEYCVKHLPAATAAP